MEKFRLKRTGDKDISFTGELLASGFTTADRQHHNFSGETGREKSTNLYLTKAGKYIIETESTTRWAGERDTIDIEILEGKDEVFEFLGSDIIADQIYREWGESPVEEIE